MKTFAISFNRKNLEKLLRVLNAFGFGHYLGKSLEECLEYYQDDFYPYLKIDLENKFFSGLYKPDGYTTYTYEDALVEIINLINSPKSITIENVGDFTAEVFKDKVKVGCQTISPEKVEEIYNAIKTLTK